MYTLRPSKTCSSITTWRAAEMWAPIPIPASDLMVNLGGVSSPCPGTTWIQQPPLTITFSPKLIHFKPLKRKGGSILDPAPNSLNAPEISSENRSEEHTSELQSRQ